MEDQRIIELFWARSESALEELEQKYGSRALRFAGHILDNHRDAEECVNDALHALWDRIPPERPASLWAFFCRVLRNICCDRADHIHADKRAPWHEVCLSELEGCLLAGQDIQSTLEARALQEAINTFLEDRTPADRVVFVRRYYCFDTCGEIAQRLGISRGAVNTRLSRLRKELKRHLEKEELLL